MFQTKVVIPESSFKIDYYHKILTMGSCFAENIGKRMKDACFDIVTNPFGVLYNPYSISNSLRLLMNNKHFERSDIFENRGLWQSFAHSSLFSSYSVEECLDNMNIQAENAINFLKDTDYLLITFGTAWVFEEMESGRVVSNCHKLPASNFKRRRLSTDEIVTDYSELIIQLVTLNPKLKIVFSVSPIRHWKDGAHENNISKSTLHLAIDELSNKFDNVYYFPAYEIQMDELRDYRFYAADMVHPSDVAVDYIWMRFSDTYFDKPTTILKKELERLNLDFSHRPLKPDSDEYQLFKRNIEIRKQKILSEYPFLLRRIK